MSNPRFEPRCPNCNHAITECTCFDANDQPEELTLIVDYDAEIGTHYVIVLNKRTGEELLFRPGFRTHEAALAFGDEWMQQYGFVVKGGDE